MARDAVEWQSASPTPEAILEEASERLLTVLHAAPTDAGGVERIEAVAGLRAVVREAHRILSAGVEDPAEAQGGPEHPTYDARVIRALRGAVLALELPATAAPPALAVVRALETLLERVLGDDLTSLAGRLAQPDALQLLVEVAHDLRSPLTSILFLSETLRTGHSGEVNEQQRSQLGLIYSAALGLASLASNVIDLAREGRGLIESEPELYSFSEMVRGVQEMVQPMADEKGVELRVAVPEYDKAHGHPIALGRVILNLTTNALKFTDEGWVEIGVKRHSASRVEFYVLDTGRGISEERQDELFNPFKKRLYSTGHFFSGSGVGLSIARRIVRGMGSELEIDTGDWGTSFSFTLDLPTPR
jgi:signal transduction histidine kinase